jgi:hypothetical protein
MKKHLDSRIAALEERVQRLADWQHRCESHNALNGIVQRFSARVHELGPGKVDLDLIAKLNTVLGTDLLPVVGRKQARKTAGKPKKKP